jgi:hemoglobin/transferrin/lactoferrin receptor protein
MFAALLLAGVSLSAIVAARAEDDTLDLDTITVLATKTEEKAIDSMAGVSIVSAEKAKEILPTRFSDILAGIPGVWTQTNADDPGTSISIRGLQDFGRVAVIVDGARQNFQVSEHGGQGKFYFDPEMFSSVEVARGPVSNIYGSGAIGGVVSISTKEAADILAEGDRYGASVKGLYGSNESLLGSVFLAAAPNENVEAVLGVSHRQSDDYADGNGNTVVNTGSESTSEMAKLTFRPGEGHEIKLSVINLDSTFDTGQPDYDPAGSGIEYGNDVATTTATAKYTFTSPTNPLIDFSGEVYWSETRQDMVVKDGYTVGDCNSYCADYTGPVGTKSYYEINTTGFDVNNSSRFDGLGFQNTLTYGGDFFHDDVDTGGDSYGLSWLDEEGYKSTPSGTRDASGAFVQWLAEKGTWLDIIGAVRYDSFQMESEDNAVDGDRFSPKLTVGFTPLDGFTLYGTYAEGYRAPAVTEAFVTGYHPGAYFKYIPNPGLRPETGKTLEAGINFKRDDAFAPGDTLRFKANVFVNNLSDFIDFQNLSSLPTCDYSYCYGYVNVSNARIQGFEAEGTYDAGNWFITASGSVLDGKDVDTGERLYSVLPGQVYVAVGARFFDHKVTVTPNWRFVTGVDDGDDDTDYRDYHLLGLNIAYQPNERTTASLVIDNILDEYYTPYLQNLPAPGVTVKASLEIKLGYK